MSRFALIFLLLFSSSAFAQDGNWSFGVTSSITLDYRVLISDGSSTANFIKDSRNNNEKSKLSYRAGALVRKQVKNRWSLETGLIYSVRGYNRSLDSFRYEDQIDPSSGFVNPTSEPYNNDPNDLKSHFRYVEIPISFLKSFGKENMAFMLGVGSSIDFLVSSNESYSFKKINVSPHVNAGLDFKVNESQSISVSLFYRMGVINITDSPVTAKLWTSGLQVSYFISP